MILIIAKSIIIGFFASVGLGPVTVFVLKRGMGIGFRSAFLTGLGSALVDTFYGTIAFVGAAYAISLLEAYEGYIRVGIMVLLITIGLFLLRSKQKEPNAQLNKKKAKYFANFISALSLALSNPFLILVYLTIFSILPVADIDLGYLPWPLVSLGLIIGTSLWWFMIAFTSNKFKNKLPELLLSNLNKAAGMLLISLGIFSGISGILILIKSF